jgi:hypothetical protein
VAVALHVHGNQLAVGEDIAAVVDLEHEVPAPFVSVVQARLYCTHKRAPQSE